MLVQLAVYLLKGMQKEFRGAEQLNNLLMFNWKRKFNFPGNYEGTGYALS